MATNNAVNTTLAGQSGTGSFVGTNSSSLVTPILGVASATSINFGGDALANYVSKSTFTPTFTFATPGDLSVSYSSQTGIYTRIGSMVFYSLNLVCTPTFTTASGALTVAGLPITIGGTVNGNNVIVFAGATTTYPAGRTALFSVLTTGGTSLKASSQGSAVASSDIVTTSVVSGVSLNITATGFYFV